MTGRTNVLRLRNRTEEIVYSCFGIFFVLVGGGLVFALLDTTDDPAGNLPASTWAFVALLLVLGAASLAFARTAVLIAPESDTFEVRNSWSRQQIAWSEVKDFRPGIFSGIVTRGYRWPVVVLELADGRTIRCQGLTGARQVPEFIAELEAELARHTGRKVAA